MKYGITKMYEAAPGAGGGATPEATKAAIMTELGNIKSALLVEVKKEVGEQSKNAEEKLAAIEGNIKALQEAKPEVTLEELNQLKADAVATQKALDILQTRMKADARKYNGGGGGSDFVSIGQAVIDSLQEKKNEIMTESLVGKAMKDQGMKLKAVQDMTVIGSVNTGVVPNTYRSGIVPQPYELMHLRNLVAVTPSDTDSYHFFRHATTGEGAITWQGNENGAKAQFDEDLVEVTITLDYLAGFLKISRKMLRNFSALQSTLSRWLPEKYYQAEDIKGHQYLIANATGVQDTTGTDMMSMIIRTIGKQKKAKYNVNGIVVDGDVWSRLLTYKATTSGEFTQPIGVVNISATGQLMICGIPVYTVSWVANDEAIIADWRFFEIIQSEGLSLGFFEQDDKNIQQNKITVRIEASVGFAMLDPKAFVVASLASVS